MAAMDNGNANAAGGQQPTAAGRNTVFRVLAQYVKDLSFENPFAPNVLGPNSERPKINLDVNVGATGTGDKQYEVTLKISAEASHSAGKYYVLEVEYAGLVRVENVPDNALQPFLLINGPALLFPFVRRLIADLTREGGYPPLLLDPIDFMALYAQNARAQQGQTSPAAVS